MRAEYTCGEEGYIRRMKWMHDTKNDGKKKGWNVTITRCSPPFDAFDDGQSE